MKYDWHDATDEAKPFACVFTVDNEGSEDDRIADFYGPKAVEHAEAYASYLNYIEVLTNA